MLRSVSSAVRSLSVRSFSEKAVTFSSTPTGAPSKKDVDELFKDDSDSQEPQRRHAYSENNVQLLGGVAEDPLVRTAKNGAQYAKFTVITNERNNITERHSITAFGRAADYVKDAIHKGLRVRVTGRLHYTGGEKLEDGTRTPRMTHIHAEHVHALAKRPGGGAR